MFEIINIFSLFLIYCIVLYLFISHRNLYNKVLLIESNLINTDKVINKNNDIIESTYSFAKLPKA
jgi:hypothetical protein